MNTNQLSDDELVSRLRAICLDSRRLDTGLLVHLIEVEERRLHLASACSSLFDFCVRRLGMSEGAAFRRMTAARLARRLPTLLAHLESGKIHLSTVVMLRDHLTEHNVEELVEAASGKTKRQVEELLAARAPRPDVPARIRKLPSKVSPPTLPLRPLAEARSALPAARIEPLSPARYKVQLTASAELREKLERARDLMRHRNPSGDLAAVVEGALDVLLEKLERERLGKAKKPSRARRPVKAGHIARAVRREVFERDGEQCTFFDDQGRRCPSRAFLEIDHIDARALGGGGEVSNLRVRCRAHNHHHAEEVFGRSHVARHIHFRQQKYAEPSVDAATRGLVNLGFRDAEARRAVSVVRERHVEIIPLEATLREALAVLTA